MALDQRDCLDSLFKERGVPQDVLLPPIPALWPNGQWLVQVLDAPRRVSEAAFWHHVSVSSHLLCLYTPPSPTFFSLSPVSFRLASIWIASPCKLVVIYLAAVS